MKHKVFIAIFLLLLAFAANATTPERGISPAIDQENNPELEEVYRIRIENKVSGAVEVSEDEGKTWKMVGKVLYPTEKVSETGYAAAAWVYPGNVAAAAVNSIHIKTGSPEVERTIFSILPKEFLMPPKEYRSFLSPDSSIYTDIKAGTSIFGGGFSPYVGNRVMLARPTHPVALLAEGYIPQIGDVLYIFVDRPKVLPKEIVFENRFGGRISMTYYSGEEKIIGEVLMPVTGIGRFEGSRYVDPGRIRANHAGVIDVSVSPYGSYGGFQIVPALHGQEMKYVRQMTQWMVIGPSRAEDPSLEGMAPFYKYFIHPDYRSDDLEAVDWEQKLLSRYLVEVKYKDEEEWKPMPIYSLRRGWRLPGWASRVFDKVSHFRMFFPVGDLE